MSVKNLASTGDDRPTPENGKVVLLRRRRKAPAPPRRQPNASRRAREYLTPDEANRLIRSAQEGRYGQRDATALLLAYRHGLRVSELVALRWDQIELKAGLLHVARLKNGVSSTHPLSGPELRALRQLRRDWPDSPYVFWLTSREVVYEGSVRS